MRARNRVGLLILAVAAPSLLLLPSEPAGAGEAPTSLRIGLVRSLFRDAPPSLIQVLSRPLKSLMESQAGLTGDLVLAGDAFDLGRKLKARKVQLGVFHGFEFAWARQQNPDLKPLVIAVCEHRLLHAHLVIRKDNAAKACGDLKGTVLAVPCMSREHCHLYLKRRCPGAGADTHKFFSQITTPTSADDALADVVDGLAGVALVDRCALEGYQRRKPSRANKLRVLQQSEAFPAAVIAYQAGTLDSATLARFRDGLVGADKTVRGKTLLKMCRITRFEAVPAEYERQLADIARAYPADKASK